MNTSKLILETYFKSISKQYIEKYGENSEEYLSAIADENNYLEIINKCSMAQLDLIIRYSKYRIKGRPIHGCYRFLLKVVNAKNNLDSFASNHSNYSKNKKSELDKLKRDSIKYNKDDLFISIPLNKEELAKTHHSHLQSCLSLAKRKAFIKTLHNLK